jgi:HEAT repeat protein
LLSLSTALPLITIAPTLADEGEAPATPAPAAATPVEAAEPAEAPAPAETAAPAEPAAPVPAPPARTGGATTTAAPNAQAAQLWSDFNHYVRIARPDLAQASGTALLNSVNDEQLLDVVEAGEYRDWERTLQQASRIDTLKDIGQQISDKIQAARIARSQEPERIRADIQRLGENERARLNAITRLRAAGQFAAPALLSTLMDERQARLHPYVLDAVVAIGRPVVYPLSVALPDLEPVPQGQVAQALAQIGYPRAVPYLKQVLENEKTDPTAKSIAEAAYRRLAAVSNVPEGVSAAELFLTLGQNHYAHGTRMLPVSGAEAEEMGVVWTYDRAAGLVPTRVPNAIFHDVLAMRAARTALAHESNLDPALSLWLGSNLRRENRLGEQKDVSYPQGLLAPAFYLEMAGPLRQHDVLNRALEDRDPALALDAINALADTAGTEALVNREGTAQPLLRALSFPDRRVRYNAAFALANARPTSDFPGAHRVVPVLGEALRQSDERTALVLGPDQDRTNTLAAAIREMGYTVFAGTSLDEVSENIATGPGIDLVVIQQDADRVESFIRNTANDYKVASVPTVAIVTPADRIELAQRLRGNQRVVTAEISEDAASLRPAIEQASAAYAGQAVSPEEGQEFALRAINLLRDIALNTAGIYNVTDAQPALVGAMNDKRAPVVTAAASVLAMIPNAEAQNAIADAALDVTRAEEMRIALLHSLAESATLQGNKISQAQSDKVLELTRTSQGDLAQASARAHGALTLPTSNLVPMIVK